MNITELAGHISKWANAYLPSIFSGGTALIISALMDIRAKKPFLYTFTGALICGVVALALSALLEHFGLPENSGAFVGAVIGFVGADRLRDMALAFVARKTGAVEDENQQ